MTEQRRSRLRGWTLALALGTGSALAGTPETVTFPSADATTTLKGYLFRPEGPGPHPAVVMLHGRAGPYAASAARRGQFDAESLAARHRMWGQFWADRGYLALHVDSFSPRGYGAGFPRNSFEARPLAVRADTGRPRDAQGALDYLRARADVDGARVGLHGWSNGAMTVLSVIGQDAPQDAAGDGFRAAIAQYPGCGTQLRQTGYLPRMPLLLMVASEDEEVSPLLCRRLVEKLADEHPTRADGHPPIRFVWYEGARHGYDSPEAARQVHPPNRLALEQSLIEAEQFFAAHLRRADR